MAKSANSEPIQLGRFGMSAFSCATLAQSRRKVGRASL